MSTIFTDSTGKVRLEGALTGSVTLATFVVTGSMTLPATLDATNIPTADPHVVGQVWANSHVLTVSAG
jgi:hypothetical protein